MHPALLAGEELGSAETLQKAMGVGPDKSALTTLCAMFAGKIKKRESSAKLLGNNGTITKTAKSFSVTQ